MNSQETTSTDVERPVYRRTPEVEVLDDDQAAE